LEDCSEFGNFVITLIVNLTVFMTNAFDWNTRNPVEEARDIWYRVTSNVTQYTRPISDMLTKS